MATANLPKKAISSSAFCLIVDDDRTICGIIAYALNNYWILTEECGDASSALHAIKCRSPDLIFLDIALERSDAVEVLRGLAEIQFRGLVVLISGCDPLLLADIKRVGENYSLRMLPCLQKPIRLPVMAEILRAAGFLGRSTPRAKAGLFEALCGGWMELCYQPKVDLRSKKIVGAEGLARVNDSEYGAQLPGSFLPGAEEVSLLSLGQFSVLTALRDWRDFAKVGAPLRLSINVPMDALNKLPIAAVVRENRPNSVGWPGLILEISEDQMARDVRLTYAFAAQLSIYNIHLAIDRFCGSPSAAKSLLELPHVELKLDRSLVVGCGADPAKRELCETLITVAHDYKRKVVAVGIEHLQDATTLTKAGCDFGQGNLFCSPQLKEQLCQKMLTFGNKMPFA